MDRFGNIRNFLISFHGFEIIFEQYIWCYYIYSMTVFEDNMRFGRPANYTAVYGPRIQLDIMVL